MASDTRLMTISLLLPCDLRLDDGASGTRQRSTGFYRGHRSRYLPLSFLLFSLSSSSPPFDCSRTSLSISLLKHYVIASQSQRRVRGRPLYHWGGVGLYNFLAAPLCYGHIISLHKVQLIGVRISIAFVHIRKFFKTYLIIVRFTLFLE